MIHLKKYIGYGLGIAALTLLANANSFGAERIPAEYRTGGFAIGCQAYSFNHFTLFEAIEKTAETGGKVIELFPGQKLSKEEPGVMVDHNASDETLQKIKDKLKKHGIMAVNYGVVGMPNNEAECRKVFEFAKKMGIPAVTSEPDMETMDLLEKLVKEYDIKVGIHNHPKQENNPNYKVWDPNYVLSMVKGRDARIGSAADTGHWTRSGIKPVDALRILQGHIISSHLKDLNKFGGDAHDVPYGTGVSDVRGVLTELRRQGFDGNISLEYEYNWDNSVPEIAQCIGYVRGFTDGSPFMRQGGPDGRFNGMTPAMLRRYGLMPSTNAPAPAVPPKPAETK
jgi:sugar phosphate isomerase/epimerase